jgi:hypothetical protein
MARGMRPLLTVTSGSMRPLLRRGDEVQIAATPWQQLAPGAIIVVRRSAALFTHRYWGATVADDGSQWLVTRGDRMASFDRPVPTSAYIGCVVARRRQGRVLLLNAPAGRRVSKRLTALSAWELRLLARLLRRPSLAELPTAAAASTAAATPINFTAVGGSRLDLRLLRALLHIGARLLLVGVRTTPMAATAVGQKEIERRV